MAPCSCPSVIQVSTSPEIPNWLEKTLFTSFSEPKSSLPVAAVALVHSPFKVHKFHHMLRV